MCHQSQGRSRGRPGRPGLAELGRHLALVVIVMLPTVACAPPASFARAEQPGVAPLAPPVAASPDRAIAVQSTAAPPGSGRRCGRPWIILNCGGRAGSVLELAEPGAPPTDPSAPIDSAIASCDGADLRRRLTPTRPTAGGRSASRCHRRRFGIRRVRDGSACRQDTGWLNRCRSSCGA